MAYSFQIASLDSISYKTWALIGILFFAILFLGFGFNNAHDDVVVFYEFSELFKSGQIPYKDFTTAYPQLSFLFFIIPGFVSSDLEGYAVVFAFMMTVFFILTYLLVLKICAYQKITTALVPTLFLILSYIYYNSAIHKFDIAVAFTIALSFYFCLQRSYNWAVISAFVGTMIKLSPAILIPAIIILSFRDRDTLRGTLKTVLLCISVCVLMMVVMVACGFTFEGVFDYLSFNTDRGFHYESTVAMVAMIICELTGGHYSFVYANYTYDVDAPLCTVLSGYWNMCMALILAIVFLIIVITLSKNKRQDSEEDHFKTVLALFILVLTAFLLSSKVFSTQFLLWIYPLMALFVVYRPKIQSLLAYIVMIALIWLSIEYTHSLNPWELMIRDGILFLLIIKSLHYLHSGDWRILPVCRGK